MSRKKTRAKKQHYISQHYFRNFSTKNGKLYVYDKDADKFYWRDIQDVGEENYFFNLGIVDIYNRSDDQEKRKIDEASIKDGFKPISEMTEEEKEDLEYVVDDLYSNQYEPEFSTLISQTINNAKQGKRILLDDVGKAKFAHLLALHHIKTKYVRDFYDEMRVSMVKQTTAIMAQFDGIHIKPEDLTVTYTKEQKRLFHISAIIDDELIDKLTSIFFNYTWQFVFFDRGSLFLTDKLMSLCPTEEIIPMFPPSFATYGMVIEVPLSKRLLLIMSDRRKFNERTDCECTPFNVYSNLGLKASNRNSVACSYKYVFSSDSKQLEEAVRSFKEELNDENIKQ